jgi:hypothetical protein
MTTKTKKKLKVLTKKDDVYIIFGEWFDKTYGNTYYDCEVTINDECFELPSQYGYNAGDIQSIDEALEQCGYRVRECKADIWAPYRQINKRTIQKKKRELF